MNKKATKKNAVALLLDSLGIDRNEVIYFGDDNDDLESIIWCGRGIAVSNAIPAVLNAADDVALSNDSDVVARYIEERILCEYDT